MCESKARLDGKVIIVTGGSSGIGYEAAKNLAGRGARVVLASRNETKLAKATDQIRAETGNQNVAYRVLNLASFKSVRNFATETIHAERSLDVLINNAGGFGQPDILTEDGLNMAMQVNYFSVFLLTYLLLPMLKASAPSRIITGTAVTMYFGEIDFDHWNDIGRYSKVEASGNSKLADALFTVELERRLKGTGVTANGFDPFFVPDTNILTNLNFPNTLENIARLFGKIIGQPKEQVGAEIAYLASEPSLKQLSGVLYKFCSRWPNHWLSNNNELTSKLWEETKKVVQISNEEDWEKTSYYYKSSKI